MSQSMQEQLADFQPDVIGVTLEQLEQAFRKWEEARLAGECLSESEAQTLDIATVSQQRAEAMFDYLKEVKNGI